MCNGSSQLTTKKINIEESYQTFGGMVYRRCMKLLNNEAQAMDAMQDVFIQLLRKQDSLENNGMSSLLYRMATNISLNMIRFDKVRGNFRQKDNAESAETNDGESIEPGEIADTTQSLEQQYINSDTVAKLFQGFPPRTKEAAIYHYVDGFTLDEIAEMMKMSNSNVRRILRELRQQVASANK
jgi:RNA polymerase sigma-70 factor, ECF subfamily